MGEDEMSKADFTIKYDGEALKFHTMDVRDLAPALLAAGQLVDAANHALNGESARINVKVKATGEGSFAITLEIVQTYAQQIVGFLKGDEATAAANLLALLGGVGGLFSLVRFLRGQKPERIKKDEAESVTIYFQGKTMVVPLNVLRLYQDLAVRSAVDGLIYEPLQKDGIDEFVAFPRQDEAISISKGEAESFKRPEGDEQVLTDDVRRSAFSIVALAFKDDNKWRLHDGNNQISASINDEDFLRKVNQNEISFAKGDVLICDVRFKQIQTERGLRTDYTVERVIDHKPAARQLRLPIMETPLPRRTGPSERDDDIAI
ncbi:hypothetical protein [Methylobacterium tarhaniae]|uniref:hypothetical protein n=1 Tax=Methylobacterium tarhaniae TaxID=1187852 RepID=UPI003D0310B6